MANNSTQLESSSQNMNGTAPIVSDGKRAAIILMRLVKLVSEDGFKFTPFIEQGLTALEVGIRLSIAGSIQQLPTKSGEITEDGEEQQGGITQQSTAGFGEVVSEGKQTVRVNAEESEKRIIDRRCRNDVLIMGKWMACVQEYGHKGDCL